jgi:hypothetical protein
MTKIEEYIKKTYDVYNRVMPGGIKLKKHKISKRCSVCGISSTKFYEIKMHWKEPTYKNNQTYSYSKHLTWVCSKQCETMLLLKLI